ncbi:MAG: superoxide dismutase [Ni] [Melioribacteraceae bacterium]
MKNLKLTLMIAVIIYSFAISTTIYAHCEIPCGIYADSLRIEMIKEHVTTIEKSMNMINKLSTEGDKNYNQIVRWVVNKEEHAKKIQEIVSQYFLHQRIKLTDTNDKVKYAKYLSQLASLHEILVYSMKSKQTTDLSNTKKLSESVNTFVGLYFHKH